MRVEGIINASDLCKRLNNDKEIKEKVGDKPITVYEVRGAKDRIEMGTKRSIDAIIRNSKSAQEMVSHARAGLQVLMENTDRFNAILNSLFDHIEKQQQEKIQPLKEIETGLKVLDTARKTVEALRSNDEVRQLLHAGTVNVQNGMSLDEVFELIIKVGEELGATQEKTVEAFAKARANRKDGIIDL